jgi:CPA1 family monovalent cation:H+ antiporter
VKEVEFALLLFVAIALLATAARKIGVPYPIVMVIGGLLLGLAAEGLGLPRLEVDPELVLVLFLPPLLLAAAYFTSIRDFKANLRPIALLSIALVLATVAVVAIVAMALIPGLTWPVAFALGAIVSPPDAVAATSIMGRLGVPRRIVTILEGESLVNDATALVVYRVAVAAAVTGTFSLADLGVRFVLVGVGGVVVGLLLARLAMVVFRRLNDPPVEVLLTLLVPYGTYIAAEAVGASGVLATVAAGLYFGRAFPRVTGTDTRVLATSVWQMVIFVLNGFVFVLIGLQLPTISDALTALPATYLLGLGVAISLTVILVRIAWVFPATYLPRMLSARIRERDPAPPWQAAFIVAWSGMRGVVSLAAALALPLTVEPGAPFPQRGLLIFLAFGVILATLVGQGLTLPWLIERLGIAGDTEAQREERTARAAAAEAAIRRIGELEHQWPGHRPLLDQLRTMYDHRVEHLGDPADGIGPELDQELVEHKLIRQGVIQAERDAVIGLRDEGVINDEVLRRVERDLDLEELRMEA